MSGSVTAEQVKWLKSFTGVDLTQYVAASAAVSAAPPKTKTINTPFGDFAYLDKPGSKVDPVMTEVVRLFLEAEASDEELDDASIDLGDLEDKFKGLQTEDIAREVAKNTSHDVKNEAGAARGADIADDGFQLLLRKLTQDLEGAKTTLTLSEDEVKQADLEDKAAELAKQAKEWEDGISKILDLVTGVAKIAINVEDPGAWIDLGKDLLKNIISAENPLAKQAEEMAKQAHELKSSILQRKVGAARKMLKDLIADVAAGNTLVGKAAHDLQVKRKTADTDFDKQTKGTVRMQDLKDGIATANKVFDRATKTVAGSHNARTLLIGLMRLQGKPETWMADVGRGQNTIDAILEGLRGMYVPAEPKLNWSKGLAKKFQEFYRAAGNAMADGADA